MGDWGDKRGSHGEGLGLASGNHHLLGPSHDQLRSRSSIWRGQEFYSLHSTNDQKIKNSEWSE